MSELKNEIYHRDCESTGSCQGSGTCFISQPALSKFLTRTEEMYGVQLLERIGENDPNYAGKQYLEYANRS